MAVVVVQDRRFALQKLIPSIFDTVIGTLYLALSCNVWIGFIFALTALAYFVVTILMVKYCIKIALVTWRPNGGVEAVVTGFPANVSGMSDSGEPSGVLLLFHLLHALVLTAGFVSGLLCGSYLVFSNEGNSPSCSVGDLIAFSVLLVLVVQSLHSLRAYILTMLQCTLESQQIFSLFRSLLVRAVLHEAAFSGALGSQSVFNTIKEDSTTINTVNAVEFFGIGSPGSGKTTIARLIRGVIDDYEGDIMVCGENIRNIPLLALQKKVAVITPDLVAFNHTVRSGIEDGKFDSGVRLDNGEVEAIGSLANSSNVTSSYFADDAGVDGQNPDQRNRNTRLRLTISLALFNNSPVIFVDQVVCGETVNGEFVKGNWRKIFTGKTIVILTDQVSDALHCDMIFVLKDGQIVEQGR
ncbi:unnamed protein product [Soboliphyme baturini]|uniref:ABC transporter domain-containing protein n=1 Tax=Soboliphyme baturini TaxID=241478 RepID=A0A183I8W6_9BILA|nr:unnamed protein product [Soboliphyme baturini]